MKRSVARSSLCLLLCVFGGLLIAALPTAPRPAIPPRPTGALTGSAFAAHTKGWLGSERQRLAGEELVRGNVPSFLRRFISVDLKGPGGESEARIWVSPDYVAIGTSQDFLRLPLDYPTAVRVATSFGCILPTAKMVDAIYAQAAIKLTPAPLPPGPKMRSISYYLKHRGLIEAERRPYPLGRLTAGHKKDVVLTNKLSQKSGRVAIYGWHRQEGDPIQPVSTVHVAGYADYSHGLRLVWHEAEVNGAPQSLYKLLGDPERAPLFSHEGVLHGLPTLMGQRGGVDLP